MNNTETNRKRVNVACAAIDPYIQKNIVEPTEREMSGREYIEWGDRNGYPSYLLQLYKNVASLRSVINGSVDYVCGNAVNVARYPYGEYMNRRKQTAAEFVHDLALSYFIYGGFAIQVVRSRTGDIVELYPVDLHYLRSSKENEVFYYSEDWDKGAMVKTVMYPRFLPEAVDVATSILYVKNTAMQTYPEPVYGASVKACETERSIDTYHLNAIQNGFSGGTIINFGDSAPDDETKDEIEKKVAEKFAGPGNAGRFLLTWSDGVARRVTVEQLDVKDFAEKYETLVKHCRQQIFTAFRANPNLFGIPTENLGFSSEEYASAFKLYNRTQIKPVQRLICDAAGKIFGNPEYLTIAPFTLDD